MGALAKKFSGFQLAFIAVYTGDLIAACVATGIPTEVARRWFRKEDFRAALCERNLTDIFRAEWRIASRQEREIFWTDVMYGRYEIGMKMKATELLGKAQGDFVERRVVTGPDGGPIRNVNLNLDGGGMNDFETRVKMMKRAVPLPVELVT